jgi:cell division protein FtsZ
MTSPTPLTSPTPSAPTAIPAPPKPISIKVIGVGGAGLAVLAHLIRSSPAGDRFAAINTDAASLAASAAAEKLHLETHLLRGLGSGGDPDRGRIAAQENLPRLKSLCEGMDVIFIIAGLGGGAGTGISPVLARAAKETGALVIGFVTTPFDCEGTRRRHLALEGLAELKAAADGLICLPNQKMFKLIDENTSALETFSIANEYLAEGVRSFCRLLTCPGLIDIHFDDLCQLLRDRHAESAFAVSEAVGPTRSREVAEKLLAHPLLDAGQMLAEADALMVSIIGGPDLTMAEVNRVMEQINRHCEHAQVVMGTAIDEAFRERLAVTVIAARKNLEPAEARLSARPGHEMSSQLIRQAITARPASRFGPSTPSSAASPGDESSAQGTASSRQRWKPARMHQTQLPLESASKGRFDKSEPNIHRGEDLDLPTYVRRGVALN